MFGKRNHARILKHHRNSAVYRDGRYLHVDMKISARSKRGREIARETAAAILNEVGANERAFSLISDVVDNEESPIQQAPKPPDSFSREDAERAVHGVRD